MNEEQRFWRIQDLTRLDIGITRFLIWFGFGLVYATLLIVFFVLVSGSAAWWWAILALTLVFFVLGLLLWQQLVRYEARRLSQMPQQPVAAEQPSIDFATPQYSELESPRYEEPMVMIQSEVSYPSSAWEPKG